MSRRAAHRPAVEQFPCGGAVRPVAARIEVERPALIVKTDGATWGSGLAALQALRRCDDDLPVIMLGEQGNVTERIMALECDADDFICKPFNVHEVLLRIRCVLKRTAQAPLQDLVFKPPFSFNGFELDYASRTLTFQGEPVPLMQTQISASMATLGVLAVMAARSRLGSAGIAGYWIAVVAIRWWGTNVGDICAHFLSLPVSAAMTAVGLTVLLLCCGNDQHKVALVHQASLAPERSPCDTVGRLVGAANIQLVDTSD